ncbi:hypothetical protein ACFE04_007774 [Oxalis oulophora]
MGRGKFKAKPTGHRHFSTPEELLSGSSARPRTFRQERTEEKVEGEVSEEEEVEQEPQKRKGIQGIISIENPNLVKQKVVKARNIDVGKTTELSRREREEIEKQKTHERYMRLQEQGKTDQAKKDLADAKVRTIRLVSFMAAKLVLSELIMTDFFNTRSDVLQRLAIIRQQRAEAAKKREYEKAAREQKKAQVQN